MPKVLQQRRGLQCRNRPLRLHSRCAGSLPWSHHRKHAWGNTNYPVCVEVRHGHRIDVGWSGSDCSLEDKRPCTNKWRQNGTEVSGAPESLSLPGWTASRCGGGLLYISLTSFTFLFLAGKVVECGLCFLQVIVTRTLVPVIAMEQGVGNLLCQGLQQVRSTLSCLPFCLEDA